MNVADCSGSNGFISRCKTFYYESSTVKCRTCDDGYTLENNQCKANTCTGQNCNQCPTGYLTPNGGASCS